MRRIVLSIVTGIVLAALGVGLSITAPNQKKANGSGTAEYSTTWTATKLLVAQAWGRDDTTLISEIALGPAAWQVDGRVDQSQYYREYWTVATPPEFRYTYSGGGSNIYTINYSDSAAKGKWMASIYPDKGLITTDFVRRLSLTLRPVSQVVNSDGQKTGEFKGDTIGGTKIDITSGYTGALSTTGTYSFSAVADNGNSTYWATAMPLSWTVRGKICEEKSVCDAFN